MQQTPIYYKSDFKLFLRSEAGFALPFRFEFYTSEPSRPFVAKFDGYKYINCELLEDGRLMIAFDDHGMKCGRLMMKQTYYLDDVHYRTEVCDRAIAPQPVINIDDHEMRSEIILAMNGDDTIEFTTQLPPYYQAGLTPEEHQALLDATKDANGSAASANEEAEKAKEQTEASKKQMADVNADYTKLKGDLQKAYADTTAALAKDYTDKKAALDADYAQKKQALENDYTSVKAALGQDYTETKTAIAAEYAQKQTALASEYQAKQEALAADYARDLKSLNDRMTAIESQYAIDKAAWQKQTTDFIAECRNTFTTNEAARQKAASDQRKAEKQTFDAQIAAQDATFQSKEAQRDGAVDEATKVSQKVTLHTQLLGPYAKHVVIPLTADYATGKVLVVNPATGMVELTEKAGWGVTRLTAEALKAQHVDQGDTAFVYMLDSQGRNLNEEGIKVFVIETEVKGEDGQVIRRTLTSKFNAPNADVTISGHLQTGYDLQPDQNLLICHPLSTSSVEFLRTAEGAKEATTKLNLTAMMEKLATKEGVFLQMIAGLAEGIWDTNPESGNAREWLVGRPVIGCPDLVIPRMNDIDARSGQNKDIVVDKVAGGVVGGNQMVGKQTKATFTIAGVTHTNNGDGTWTINGTATSNATPGIGIPSVKFTAGHRYMLLGSCGHGFSLYVEGSGFSGSGMDSGSGKIVNCVNNVSASPWSMVTSGSVFDNDKVIPILLDLTTLFPLDQPFVTSLGQNDATRVLTRLGIIALDD